MKKSVFCLSLIFLFSVLTILPADAHTLEVNSGRYVEFQDMIRDLADAPLVFIGELHDQPGHHQAQLQIIQALHERGEPVSIGLEMFRAENQEDLDRWVSGEMEEAEFRLAFMANWGMWEQYEEILTYARENAIPLVGLNVPREITQQVAREGFASLSPEQLEKIPGVACDIDAEYEEYIRRTLGMHAHGDASFANFCEAQMVWDTTMAHNLLEYMKRDPQRQVVVLAGSGHSWKYGIPEQVRRRADVDYRVVLPEIPGRLAGGDVTEKEADYLLLGVTQGPVH